MNQNAPGLHVLCFISCLRRLSLLLGQLTERTSGRNGQAKRHKRLTTDRAVLDDPLDEDETDEARALGCGIIPEEKEILEV